MWYSTLKFELATSGAHVHACKLSRHSAFGGSIIPWRVPSPLSLGPVERRNNFDTAPFISYCELTDEFFVARNTLDNEIYTDILTKNMKRVKWNVSTFLQLNSETQLLTYANHEFSVFRIKPFSQLILKFGFKLFHYTNKNLLSLHVFHLQG
jgi:hypothetical protein